MSLAVLAEDGTRQPVRQRAPRKRAQLPVRDEAVHGQAEAIFDQAPVRRRVALVDAPACEEAFVVIAKAGPEKQPEAAFKAVRPGTVGEIEPALPRNLVE